MTWRLNASYCQRFPDRDDSADDCSVGRGAGSEREAQEMAATGPGPTNDNRVSSDADAAAKGLAAPGHGQRKKNGLPIVVSVREI